MRVAVISDVHANLHALEAVLRDVDREAADEVWCLGDLVGYGPRPNECCSAVAARASVCLAGNHDLATLHPEELVHFASDAATAAHWTGRVLDPPSRAFLSGLSPEGRAGDAALFHGSPRDPIWEYVLDAEAAWAALEDADAPLVLVGHSHVALAIGRLDEGLEGGLAPAGTEAELAGRRWLLNPGSVGQPRDGDPRAAYLLLDSGRGTARFRRVEYAVERTQAEIHDQGLPASLATRLASGS